MAEPLRDTDKHGLATLGRRWSPKGMRRSQAGRDLMDGLADGTADALNLLIEAEQYLPIIWDPSRNLDEDVFRVLELNGIEAISGTISIEKSRRLAVLGSDLRAFRGAFRSHRAVAGALTGGPVIIRPWLILRAIVDETDFDLIIVPLTDGFRDTTDIFVLGQGPSGTEFGEAELETRLGELARPILDISNLIACYALTAWRDGTAGWVFSGEPVLVTSPVRGEFEAVDLGPAVDPTAVQLLVSPTERPASGADPETLWSTVWFKTGGGLAADFWEHASYATDDYDDGYAIRVGIGNDQVELFRKEGGVYTSLGTHPTNIPDDLDGAYHRIDLLVHKNATKTRVRAYVDMDPTPWFDDLTVAGRPAGTHIAVLLETADFTQGTLRLGATTAKRTEE